MPQQTAVNPADAGMPNVKKRVTSKEFTDMAFERALANPDGAEAQVILRLSEQYPDKVPAGALFQEMSKAYPVISSKYELILEGAGAPGASPSTLTQLTPGKPGNVAYLAKKATGGTGSVWDAAGNLLSGSMTSVLEGAKPYVDKAIDAVAPYTGGSFGPAVAGTTFFAKNVAPPMLRAVGATDMADKVETAGKYSQDFMVGASQGFAELGMDLASPAGALLFFSGGPMRRIASKFPAAAKVVSALLSGAALTGVTKDLLYNEIPEAYEALDKADFKAFGKAIAKASGETVIGVEAFKGLKGKNAVPRPDKGYSTAAGPGPETIPAGAYPGARPIPATRPAPSTETAVDLYRRPASSVQIPATRENAPKKWEAFDMPVIDKSTGRPMTLRENTLPESEVQQMLRRPAEELIAERIAAEQRVAALERSATSQSQGGQVATVTLPDGRVQTVSASEIPLAHTKDASGNFVANPGAIQAELAQARARLAALDRMIFARERAGTMPGAAPPAAATPPPAAGQFPPASRAISTPEEIAMRHNLPVEGPTAPRTGSEAPAGSFNLNQIWRESVAEIQARLSALARERTAYTDRSSPQAIDAERRIAALQDMLKAKRTAEIGGQPVPPVQPLPLDMGALPAARPAPMGVKPEAGVPALYESPSRAVPTGEGTPPRYTGPVSPIMTPEGPMYDQPIPKPRPMPGRPAQLLPEASGEAAVLTPSGTSRVDMKALADKHKIDVEALRLVESTPDVEVVRVINELARTRAGILTGRGGQTALPGAPPAARSSHSRIKAKKGSADFEKERELSLEKIDNTINAYTELLRMRDPIYRSFVRNVDSQAPPANRSSSTPRTGRSKK